MGKSKKTVFEHSNCNHFPQLEISSVRGNDLIPPSTQFRFPLDPSNCISYCSSCINTICTNHYYDGNALWEHTRQPTHLQESAHALKRIYSQFNILALKNHKKFISCRNVFILFTIDFSQTFQSLKNMGDDKQLFQST